MYLRSIRSTAIKLWIFVKFCLIEQQLRQLNQLNAQSGILRKLQQVGQLFHSFPPYLFIKAHSSHTLLVWIVDDCVHWSLNPKAIIPSQSLIRL